MNEEELGAALRALPPEPPRDVTTEAAMTQAFGRRRRVAVLATAAVFAAGAVAFGLAQPDLGRDPLTPAVVPPERVTVGGLAFVRQDSQQLALDPALREGDEDGLYVTVPDTFPDLGPCATHYVPVVSRETASTVTVTAWFYVSATAEPTTVCSLAGRPGPGAAGGETRLQLDRPLADRSLYITGKTGPRLVRLLGPVGSPPPGPSDLAPAVPSSAEMCLDGRCVVVSDPSLLRMSAAGVNETVPVRSGPCSDAGRTDNVGRTIYVRFTADGRTGPRIEVPLGCSPLGVVDAPERYANFYGTGTDVIRIAYDQQISPDTQCMGIGGPSGGPVTKDYVGLTLAQAEDFAESTNNDYIRIAGRDGTCVGIIRDHVINRVNVYLENGVVTAAKSF